MIHDELKLYRGGELILTDYIRVRQPTLGEICDYGEGAYYSMLYYLTATPQSMKVQLWNMGVDYTTLTPYRLFADMLYPLFPKERTSILLGELDLTKFQPMLNHEDGAVVLYQIVNTERGPEEILLTESLYEEMMDYLRSMHFLEKDEKLPANQTTKQILIEDAREAMLNAKDKPARSPLKNYISAMVNSAGFKYNHTQVWDMKINAFMDSVRRISKIKHAGLLLQSGYSGYGIDLKSIDKQQLDWLGDLK